MKIQDLEGSALDYWVARARGAKELYGRSESGASCWFMPDGTYVDPSESRRTFSPSVSWAQAGPIISSHCIVVSYYELSGHWRGISKPRCGFKLGHATGRTFLVAAMRTFLVSVYGDEVADEVST